MLNVENSDYAVSFFNPFSKRLMEHFIPIELDRTRSLRSA